MNSVLSFFYGMHSGQLIWAHVLGMSPFFWGSLKFSAPLKWLILLGSSARLFCRLVCLGRPFAHPSVGAQEKHGKESTKIASWKIHWILIVFTGKSTEFLMIFTSWKILGFSMAICSFYRRGTGYFSDGQNQVNELQAMTAKEHIQWISMWNSLWKQHHIPPKIHKSPERRFRLPSSISQQIFVRFC